MIFVENTKFWGMVSINDYIYVNILCFFSSYSKSSIFAKLIGVLWHENAHKAVRKCFNNFAIFSKDNYDYLDKYLKKYSKERQDRIMDLEGGIFIEEFL